MKKAIKTTVIALAGLLTVCACNERSSLPSNTESAKDQLISRLEKYNANLVQQNSPQTKSPNWRNLTVVAIADIKGALDGGKVGGKIGAKVGSFFGVPHYGALTGAFVGGIGWGAFMSYLVYDDSPGTSYADFNTLYEQTMLAAAQAVLAREQLEVEPLSDTLYCSFNNNIADYTTCEEEFTLPEESEYCELVGMAHNEALEYAMAEEEFVEEEFVETPVITSVYDSLSPIASALLSCQEMKDSLWVLYQNHLQQSQIQTISDTIVDLFIEPYATATTNIDDVVALANDYVDMISESDALTEEEKSEVYSAISVAVYSTCFWSNYFCTQPES